MVAGRGLGLPAGRSQVNMVYIGWATHVLQRLGQRAAWAKAAASPKASPGTDRRVQALREAETVSNRASGRHGEA